MKISLMDEWDPEGFVKFEIDLPNIDTYKENGQQVGFEILAIWENKGI